MNGNKIKFATINPVSDENIPKDFIVMKEDDIKKTLKSIENKLMRKYHSAMQYSTVYDWMYNRCMLKSESDDSTVYVMTERYKPMLKIYKKGNLHSRPDLGFNEFNVLGRMFAEGRISEC